MTQRVGAGRIKAALVLVVAVIGVAVTARLGFWQLDRAAQKTALQALIDERTRMPALDVPGFLQALQMPATKDAPQAALHRTVILQGQWLAEHTVYLDNRQMQGRPGFFVLTPLQLEGRQEAVLVQRGWLPRNFQNRQQLLPVETPKGTVSITARVAPEPAKLYEFGGAAPGTEGASRIRQNLDLASYATETTLPLLQGVSVLQTGSASEGLLRDWPVVVAGVDKNYGYAFQWFGLCSLIALLYVWFQIIRPIIRRRRQPQA